MVALCLVGTLSACTHARVLQAHASVAQAERVNRDLDDRTGTITLHDGSRIDARDMRLSDDAVSWRQVDSTAVQSTRMTDLRELTFRSRLRGAFDGLVLGLLVGAPAGALFIDNPSGGSGRRLKAALSGGLSIGLWSGLVGAVKGSRMIYRVEAPSRTANQEDNARASSRDRQR
jgi:hypothetical protein